MDTIQENHTVLSAQRQLSQVLTHNMQYTSEMEHQA